ncbi:MAG: YafY family transcriptional regulator [Eubacterium sp.]|nr:YafY family transcriptional regulator [Eubacterium sp.]
MKIDRQIGIITALQRNKTVTASYLADKFEVSRRTIIRDIEDICKAGIPIVTRQGQGGGISIMEGFALDTTVFTEQELSAIFTGLKSLDSVSDSSFSEKLADKIGSSSAITLSENMLIDLSSFYKENLADKIEKIKLAIQESRLVKFRYYYKKGEAEKLIEPYMIVFKWSDWYVFGYCRERNDFRMYKLRRAWDMNITEEKFEPRAIPEEKKQFGRNMTDNYYIAAVYAPSEKYKLVEQYGPDSFTVTEDGRLFTRWGFADTDWALEWFLSFGDKVEVLEPQEFKEELKKAIKKMLEKYR